jgi:hypothetical protein
MTKKTVLSAAAVVVATGAVKGYQLLDQRYRHLLPQKEQYRLPSDTESIVVNTSIGDFKLVAAGGYFGGAGIFVYAENLVDPNAFSERVLRGDSLVHTQVVSVVPETLTKAFYKATKGQFHLERAPHTASGGDSNAFALITAGRNVDSYHSQVNGNTDPKHGNGYFKCNDAPTMRMAAHTLRTIIDGSPLCRTKKDLRSLIDGSRPVHTLHDLQTAKTIGEELTDHYKGLALTGYKACVTRVAEFRSKD